MTDAASLPKLNVLFRDGWRLVRTHFWLLFWINLWPSVISSLLPIVSNGSIALPWALTAALWILSYLLLFWAYGASVVVLLNPAARSLVAAYQRSVRYLWRIIGATVLAMVGILAGFVAVLLPGIYFSVNWSFIDYSIIDENLGVFASLNRGSELVYGRWWAVFRRVFLIGIICFIVFLAIAGLLVAMGSGAVFGFGDPASLTFSAKDVGAVLLGALLETPLTVYYTVLLYVLYRQLKATH